MEFLSLLSQLKKNLSPAISWIFGNLRLFADILLIFFLLLVGFMYRKTEKKLTDAQIQYGILADNLQQQITIRNNEIQILKRANGKVTVNTVYVPGEGYYIIQQSTPTTPGGSSNVSIIVKDKGLCLRPGMGLGWGPDGFQGLLDLKFVYYKRYSGLVTVTKNSIGFSASRHLDDILFWRPQNVEAFVTWNAIRQSNASSFLIGVRSNF